jgi:glutamate synthase (NADPH/NADH) large chain
MNYFYFIAEEIRQLMSQLGFRDFQSMIGRSDKLDMRKALSHWKAKGLDFSKLLYRPEVESDVAVYNCEAQDHGLAEVLDHALIVQAQPALTQQKSVHIELPIHNSNRTFGAMLSGEVARRYGFTGLPDDTIHIKVNGCAGQSLGAFLAHGITIELVGEANDYVGKGLSGGKLIVYPPVACPIVAEDNIIIGNTVLYGAIKGECYFCGVAGERFAVRNSGAIAVVEGVGDHGCEYMTGGIVVVLGTTGRNFAAGMSGGIAYILDEAGNFAERCNLAMVELESIAEKSETSEPSEKETTEVSTEILQDMTRHDVKRLKYLIEKHYTYTNSQRAKRILDQWQTYLPYFVKIMPLDYRRALEQLQAGRYSPKPRSAA